MKGISLQISKEGEEKEISPELLKALTDEGWTIDNYEIF